MRRKRVKKKIVYKKKIFKSPQVYEDYWFLTLGHTDILSLNATFIKVLRVISKFIDERGPKNILTPDEYYILQKKVLEVSPKNSRDEKSNLPSIRKEINQFVKLGFVEHQLRKKYPLTDIFIKSFDNEETYARRQKIFSRIVESNAKFGSSVIRKDDPTNNMNFLLSTLEEVKKINLKRDIKGLMICNISKIKKGFLTREELDDYNSKAEKINFSQKKYNQISHFISICKQMYDLEVVDDNLYFKTDAQEIFDSTELVVPQRDKYKHKIWKNELLEESKLVFNGEARCMVDNVTSQYLIGSHIIPWKVCVDEGNEFKAWDKDNGLLLNRNLDAFFDKGKISFSNDGKIILNDDIQSDLRNSLVSHKVKNDFLNEKRQKYLIFHNQYFNFTK
jgi:hypothetical protein